MFNLILSLALRSMKSFVNMAMCSVKRVGRQWREGILNNTGQRIVSIGQQYVHTAAKWSETTK